MTDQEMQEWLFNRYTNLPEYFREELADGTFTVRDCLFRLLLETEEQRTKAEDRVTELEEALEHARTTCINLQQKCTEAILKPGKES